MNEQWKEYLAASGAQCDENGMMRFNDSSSVTSPADDYICDLSHFSTVVIAGPDAVEFMQGQFTNDVSLVDDSHSQLGAFCNKKGRMVANFRLFRYQQNYFISMRSDLVDISIDHLQHFVLRAQVAIQDVSQQLVHIGVSGDGAAAALSPFIADVSEEIDSVTANEDYIAVRVAGPTPRYEIFCALDKAVELWETLSQKLEVANTGVWEYQNILAGLPFISSATSQEFVPQMANMELINGVSFTKGCYTGQEIIARTHYLGKQKRRTFRVGIESGTMPRAGDQLATDTSTDTQYVGTLITVCQTGDDSYQALAVIQMTSAEQDLRLKDDTGKVRLLELPYSLEAVSSS